MAGNPASRKTFGAAFCAVRNVKNKNPAASCFYCGFYKAALLEKLNGKCSFLWMVRNYFFQAHMQRVLLAGPGRAAPPGTQAGCEWGVSHSPTRRSISWT